MGKKTTRVRRNFTQESLDNVTLADAYFGRRCEVVSERARIRQRTMRKRKKAYLAAGAA
jgi:hypothetical protein